MKVALPLSIMWFLVTPFALAEDTVKANEGVLIIDIRAGFSTEVGANHGSGGWLRNLATGKTYGSGRENLQLLVLPEGDYCVDEIQLFPRGMGVASYCKEPYIKVASGRLNNAGQWTFIVDLHDQTVKLKSSISNSEQTLQDVKNKFPEFF